MAAKKKVVRKKAPVKRAVRRKAPVHKTVFIIGVLLYGTKEPVYFKRPFLTGKKSPAVDAELVSAKSDAKQYGDEAHATFDAMAIKNDPYYSRSVKGVFVESQRVKR